MRTPLAAFFNRPLKGQEGGRAVVAPAVGWEKAVLALDPELGEWEDLGEEELHEVGEVTGVSEGGMGVELDRDEEGRVEKMGMGHVGDVGLQHRQNWFLTSLGCQ